MSETIECSSHATILAIYYHHLRINLSFFTEKMIIEDMATTKTSAAATDPNSGTANNFVIVWCSHSSSINVTGKDVK
jgi:hypothetical protein